MSVFVCSDMPIFVALQGIRAAQSEEIVPRQWYDIVSGLPEPLPPPCKPYGSISGSRGP